MTPKRLLATGVMPALIDLERQGIPDTVDARRLLLAIAMQESGLAHRRQVVSGGTENGPAASFWQFEQGGGCKGVLTHRAVSSLMIRACEDYNIAPTPAALWEGMRYNDVIAATAARLLVYTLPSGLPKTQEEGWSQYLSAWRPGKPHPDTWPLNWQMATATVGLRV